MFCCLQTLSGALFCDMSLAIQRSWEDHVTQWNGLSSNTSVDTLCCHGFKEDHLNPVMDDHGISTKKKEDEPCLSGNRDPVDFNCMAESEASKQLDENDNLNTGDICASSGTGTDEGLCFASNHEKSCMKNELHPHHLEESNQHESSSNHVESSSENNLHPQHREESDQHEPVLCFSSNVKKSSLKELHPHLLKESDQHVSVLCSSSNHEESSSENNLHPKHREEKDQHEFVLCFSSNAEKSSFKNELHTQHLEAHDQRESMLCFSSNDEKSSLKNELHPHLEEHDQHESKVCFLSKDEKNCLKSELHPQHLQEPDQCESLLCFSSNDEKSSLKNELHPQHLEERDQHELALCFSLNHKKKCSRYELHTQHLEEGDQHDEDEDDQKSGAKDIGGATTTQDFNGTEGKMVDEIKKEGVHVPKDMPANESEKGIGCDETDLEGIDKVGEQQILHSARVAQQRRKSNAAKVGKEVTTCDEQSEDLSFCASTSVSPQAESKVDPTYCEPSTCHDGVSESIADGEEELQGATAADIIPQIKDTTLTYGDLYEVRLRRKKKVRQGKEQSRLDSMLLLIMKLDQLDQDIDSALSSQSPSCKQVFSEHLQAAQVTILGAGDVLPCHSAKNISTGSTPAIHKHGHGAKPKVTEPEISSSAWKCHHRLLTTAPSCGQIKK